MTAQDYAALSDPEEAVRRWERIRDEARERGKHEQAETIEAFLLPMARKRAERKQA